MYRRHRHNLYDAALSAGDRLGKGTTNSLVATSRRGQTSMKCDFRSSLVPSVRAMAAVHSLHVLYFAHVL